MARKAIRATDVVAKNVFTNAIKGAKTLLDVFGDLKKSIAETGKELEGALKETSFEKAEDIVKFNKAIEQTAALTKDLKDVQVQEAKVKKQKAALTDEELKQGIKTRKQLLDRKKALEAQITLETKEVKTLKQLREANKALRVERDNLDLTSKEGADRIAEINDEIDKNNDLLKDNVDQLTQQKIGIGNYEEAIGNALDKTSLFGVSIGDIKDSLKALTSIFKKNEKQTDDNTKATETNTKAVGKGRRAVKLFGKALKSLGIGALIAVIGGLGAAFGSSREGALESQKALIRFQAIAQVAVKRLAELGFGLIDLFKGALASTQAFAKDIASVFTFGDAAKKLEAESKALSDSAAENFERGSERIGGAFSNIGSAVDDVTDSITQLDELARLTFQFEDEIRGLERSLADLGKTEAELQHIADSSTLGFNERREALEKLQVVIAERSGVAIKIAEKQLELAERTIEAELTQAGIRGANIRDVINSEELRLKVSEEALAAQQDSLLALKEAQKEEQQVRLETNKIARELKQDELERNLDFLIDDFDNRKTVNERIIASDKATFEARAKALTDTVRLSDESFAGQVKIIEEFAGQAVDVNELINTSSEEQLVKRVRALGLSEIIEGRLLEVIRDRRTAVQELGEAEQDVFDQGFRETELLQDIEATNEALNALSEFDIDNVDVSKLSKSQLEALSESIKTFNEKLEEENEELAKKRTQNEIDLLKKEIEARIELGQKGSEIVLAQQKELNDKLLDQQKNRLKAEQDAKNKAIADALKADEEQLKKEQELRDVAIGAAEAFFQARAEKRIASIDKELEAVQTRQDQLRTLAEQGSKEAVESLALEQRKEAELQVQREKELKTQQRIELGLTALKTFTSKVDANDEQPLQSTFRDLLQLKSFVSAFPGFYEGTDSVGTGDGVKLNAAKDNLLVRVHEGERIMGVSDSKKLQGYTNEGIVSLVKAHEQGVFSDNISVAKVSSPSNGVSLASLEQLSEISATLKNLPNQMPTSSTDYNSLEGMITDVVKTKGSTRRTKMRAGWR